MKIGLLLTPKFELGSAIPPTQQKIISIHVNSINDCYLDILIHGIKCKHFYH